MHALFSSALPYARSRRSRLSAAAGMIERPLRPAPRRASNITGPISVDDFVGAVLVPYPLRSNAIALSTGFSSAEFLFAGTWSTRRARLDVPALVERHTI